MVAPTYSKMGDPTETIQVDYDPTLISYSQLLDIFWQSHLPEKSSWSRQYMRAVFYHDEDQRQQAVASRDSLEHENGYTVKTKVVPLRSFTLAEDYHQKYLLKMHAELEDELVRIYPSHQDLVDSTAAARLNGYAGGHGNKAQLSREIDSLGLSQSGRKKLLKLVQR